MFNVNVYKFSTDEVEVEVILKRRGTSIRSGRDKSNNLVTYFVVAYK